VEALAAPLPAASAADGSDGKNSSRKEKEVREKARKFSLSYEERRSLCSQKNKTKKTT